MKPNHHTNPKQVSEASKGLMHLLVDSVELPTGHEARFLVDFYYDIQHYRKSLANQTRSLKTAKQDTKCIQVFHDLQFETECAVKKVLGRWADSQPIGQWAQSIPGVGPVLTAGLMAYIDITQAPTVGHIWRFAGLDPTQHWLGAIGGKQVLDRILANNGSDLQRAILPLAREIGTRPETLTRLATTSPKTKRTLKLTKLRLAKAAAKRPWNARLKTLCWLIGESFVKVSNNAKDIYGGMYVSQKELYQSRNDAGDYAETAAAQLKDKKFGRSTEAYKHLKAGHLSPAQIHARAKRWAVKLFLAHYHERAYVLHYGKPPPKPYPIEVLGHAHYMPPPGGSQSPREYQVP